MLTLSYIHYISRSQVDSQLYSLHFEVAEVEPECSCLQTRVVEDDLMNGVNPLGLVSNQCYQVPTEIINNLHGPNGIKQIEKNYCNESPGPVPCRLGFVRVCNSDSSTLTSTAICPAGHGEVRSKTVTSV